MNELSGVRLPLSIQICRTAFKQNPDVTGGLSSAAQSLPPLLLYSCQQLCHLPQGSPFSFTKVGFEGKLQPSSLYKPRSGYIVHSPSQKNL